jgi:RecQ-mediated genome instability protein 1
MLAGTGLPPNVSELDNAKLPGPPVLVEIVSMTEIGQSAFNLQNVHQARIERADLAGLAGDEAEDEDPEAGPVPKYPRSMLRFQLSDGSTVLDAIEYRKIPEFELGATPLGYKVRICATGEQNIRFFICLSQSPKEHLCMLLACARRAH